MWLTPKPQGNILDVDLEREHPITVLNGSIIPPPGTGNTIKIVVEGQEGETSPDEIGRFKLEVSGKPGDRVRLKVYSRGKLAYDDYQVLPGPVTLILQKGH
jgi:hypothetical protein